MLPTGYYVEKDAKAQRWTLHSSEEVVSTEGAFEGYRKVASGPTDDMAVPNIDVEKMAWLDHDSLHAPTEEAQQAARKKLAAYFPTPEVLVPRRKRHLSTGVA